LLCRRPVPRDAGGPRHGALPLAGAERPVAATCDPGRARRRRPALAASEAAAPGGPRPAAGAAAPRQDRPADRGRRAAPRLAGPVARPPPRALRALLARSE